MRLAGLLFVALLASTQGAHAEVGVSVSGDGSLVAARGNYWLNQKPVDLVVLFDGHSGKQLKRFGENVATKLGAVLSPDGKMLVLCGVEKQSAGAAAEKRAKELSEELQKSAGNNAFMQGFMEAAGDSMTDNLAYKEVPYLAWMSTGSGEVVHRIKANAYLNVAAFSPDSRSVAVGTSDNKVHIYDVASGKLLRTLTGFDSEVMALSFKADGTRLAARGDKVLVWDLATGKVVRSLAVGEMDDHYHFSQSLALSPNGRYIGVSDGLQRLDLWDMATGKLLRTIRDAHAFAFSSDNSTVATASENGHVKLWNIATGQCTRTLAGLSDLPYQSVEWIQFTKDGAKLVVTGGESVTKVIDIASGQESLRTVTSNSPIRDVAFDHKGERLLTASDRGEIRLIDANTLATKETFKSSTEPKKVAFSPASDIFAVVKKAGIEFYDSTTGKQLRKITIDGSDITCLQFSNDGKKIAGGFLDSTVHVWDADSGVELFKLGSAPPPKPKQEFSLADMMSGKFEAAIKSQAAASASSADQPRHSDAILDVEFSEDGTRIATASRDTTVRLWDANTGKFQKTLTGHAAQINAVAFTDGGKELVSGDTDGVLKIWDTQSGAAVRTLKTPDGGTSDVATTDGGHTIITASMQMEKPNFIRFLDATSGNVTKSIPLGTDYPNKVVLTPNKKKLAATSIQGLVRIWDVDSGEAHIFEPN